MLDDIALINGPDYWSHIYFDLGFDISTLYYNKTYSS